MLQQPGKHAVHIGLYDKFPRFLRRQGPLRWRRPRPERIGAMHEPIPNHTLAVPIVHLELSVVKVIGTLEV